MSLALGLQPAFLGIRNYHSSCCQRKAFFATRCAPSTARRPTQPHQFKGQQRLGWRSAASGQESATTDGSDGGNGGASGGDGSGGSGGGDDSGPNLGGNIWVLVVTAAAALALFKVGSKKLQLRRDHVAWLEAQEWLQSGEWQQKGAEWLQIQKARLQGHAEWLQGPEVQQELQQRRKQLQALLQSKLAAVTGEPLASAEDVATLTRLTQEAFAELVKIKERLDELEQDAGGNDSTPAVASSSPSTSSGSGGGSGDREEAGSGAASASAAGSAAGPSNPVHRVRHRLAGAVRLGGGLMWAEEGAPAESGSTLRSAGVRLGTDILLQLSGLMRGGRDTASVECKIDPAANTVSIRKILYNCRLAKHARLVLAPFGSSGKDVAYTLNPLAGQGLTSLVRDGSPLHRRVLGSLAGLCLDGSRAWLSVGYFARESQAGVYTSSLLAQAVLAPLNSLSVGATYLAHRSSSSASAGTEAGVATGGLQWPTIVGLAPIEAAAAALGLGQWSEDQLGATLAFKLGDAAVLHGWAVASVDPASVAASAGLLKFVQPHQWGLVLGSYPDGSGSGWALGVGRAGAEEGGSNSSADLSTRLKPNLLELSLQHNMGDGLLLSPGLLLMKQGSDAGSFTAFLGLRSTWAF